MDGRTISIELLNEDALTLLHQLERLNLIRVVPQKPIRQNTKRQWAGSISKSTAVNMLDYLNESRNEWERNI